MISPFFRNLLISFVGMALFVVFLFHIHDNMMASRQIDFDPIEFKKEDYTHEELVLFADIAFKWNTNRLRRWHTDIRVEIKNAADIDPTWIAEVDSVIAILAPLIAPLKIERVLSDGNLHVYRHVDYAPVSNDPPAHVRYLEGLAQTNSETEYSSDIRFAALYDATSSISQALMHEFEHVLGLEHPSQFYPYYLTIGETVMPQHIYLDNHYMAYSQKPYYISEQEKNVIRMLYSPTIHAGLDRDMFMEKMGLR